MAVICCRLHSVNTLRLRQNGHHFPDDIFKCIFSNENAWISIKISLKFVPKGPVNKIPTLVQIMAWRRSGDKPLSKPMMVSLLTHICITRPQWVNFLLPVTSQKSSHHCHIFRFIMTHNICTAYIPRIILQVLCFGTLVSCQFYPYTSGLLHWHWGNHMIAPVPVK